MYGKIAGEIPLLQGEDLGSQQKTQTVFSWLIGLAIKQYGGFISWKFYFPLSAVFLGLGVAATVGLIFGLYPASQAAKKSPIEALRYE